MEWLKEALKGLQTDANIPHPPARKFPVTHTAQEAAIQCPKSMEEDFLGYFEFNWQKAYAERRKGYLGDI